MLRSLAILVLAVTAIFLIVAFGSDLFATHQDQVSHWENGEVRILAKVLRYPNGGFVRDGAYRTFFPDGRNHLVGAYRNGKMQGIWTEHDAQGRMRKRGAYRDGLEEGRWEYWYPGEDPAYEQLTWQAGRVMEGGQAVSPPPPSLPRFFSWSPHLTGYARMLVILLGALPLAMLAGASGSMAKQDPSRSPSAAEHWIVALTTWCLLQTGTALLLAAGGWLRAGPVFLVELLLFTLGIVLCWRRRIDLRRFAPPLDEPMQLVLLLASTALGLAALEKGLAVPMSDWDGLAYHLPLMAEWVQNGSIVSLPELGQTGRYPSHWELMSTLGYFAFSEDLLFTLPNMVAWAMLGLSVVVLARRAGARDTDAGASALLLLSLPLVLLQTEEMKADLPTAAAFGAALVLGGFLSDSRKVVRPTLLLLCLGWLCGLKASGPAYAGVALSSILVWWLFPGRKAPGSFRFVSAPILLAATVALVLAGFWYLRNYLELGNPLGEVQVEVLGKELFAGEIQGSDLQRTTFWSVWQPGDSADAKAIWEAGREVVGWIVIPLVLSYLVALFTGWGGQRARWITGLLLALVVICGVLYAVTPFSGDNGSHGWRLTSWVGQTWRYALPKWFAATVLASLGWNALRLPRWTAVTLAVFAAAWATALYAAPPRASLVASVVAAALLVTMLSPLRTVLLSRVLSSTPSPSRLGVTLVIAVILVLGFDAFWLRELRENRERGRWEFYTARYLYSLRTPNEQTIGIAMTQLRYPFYGRDLKQSLYDASCRGCTRLMWSRGIEENRVHALALGPEPVQRTFADSEADLRPWVHAEPDRFRVLRELSATASGSFEAITLYEIQR